MKMTSPSYLLMLYVYDMLIVVNNMEKIDELKKMHNSKHVHVPLPNNGKLGKTQCLTNYQEMKK